MQAAASKAFLKLRLEQSFAWLAGIGYAGSMDTVQAVARRAHQAAPGRLALVAPDLSALRAPVTGTVELPLRMFWYPVRTFDLGQPGFLEWVYRIVLREARHPEDLTRYLDGDTLVRLWPGLHLPPGVQQAWEARHPGLRKARLAVREPAALCHSMTFTAR